MMKIVLIILTVIAGFLVGYFLLASTGEKYAPAPEESAVETAEVEVPGERLGAESADIMLSHLISATFGIFSAFLLVTKSENNAIALFSIAVLSTLFGRYVGPLVLPGFLF
jgi:hypothetical protein